MDTRSAKEFFSFGDDVDFDCGTEDDVLQVKPRARPTAPPPTPAASPVRATTAAATAPAKNFFEWVLDGSEADMDFDFDFDVKKKPSSVRQAVEEQLSTTVYRQYPTSAPPKKACGEGRAALVRTGDVQPNGTGPLRPLRGTEADEERYFSFCDGDTRVLLRGGVPRPAFNASCAPSRIVDDAGGPEFYGLGPIVRESLYDTFGITRLHDWQRTVLDTHLLDGGRGVDRSALVNAPTSGGKTLISLVTVLHSLLVRHKDSMLILPYIAIVQEVVAQLRLLVAKLIERGAPSCFSVEEYAGAKGKLPPPARVTNTFRKASVLYVCTIEKGNILWRHFAKSTPPIRVGCLVLDELHMLGDETRGGILEELTTSVLYWSGASTQIMALSATVGNQSVLSAFLGGGNSDGCVLHHVPRRDQTLREYVVVAGAAFPISRRPDGSGHACFDIRDGEAAADDAFDVVGTLDHLTLGGRPVRGDDGNPSRLWLSTQQMRLSLQETALIKLPHRDGSQRITFPPIGRVPTAVAAHCRRLLDTGSDAAVRAERLSPDFLRAVAHAARRQEDEKKNTAAGVVDSHQLPPLSQVADPYTGTSDKQRQDDRRAWDARVVATLVVDAVTSGRSVLIFCPTRAACVAMCETVTEVAAGLLSDTTADPCQRRWPTPSAVIEKERRDIVGHLTEETDGLVSSTLLHGIRHGVAYHMALNMTQAERTAVEGAFLRRVVSVLACTTTLAAGVNLPADRVIITTPYVGGSTEFLSCIKYLQMVGRAGRTGLSSGNADAYILLRAGDVGRFQRLVEGHVESVYSKLKQCPQYNQMNRGGGPAGPAPIRDLRQGNIVSNSFTETCLTRVVVGLISTARLAPLSMLWEAYRYTLLYQAGDATVVEDARVDDDSCRSQHSPLPLLCQIQSLVEDGYVRVLLRDRQDRGNLDLRQYDDKVSIVAGRQVPGARELSDKSPMVQDVAEAMRSGGYRFATPEEVTCFCTMLSEAVVTLGDDVAPAGARGILLPDVTLIVSGFTAAADVATVSLTDASTFVRSAMETQWSLDVEAPLTIIYLAIGDNLTAKPLSDEDSMLLNTEFRDYDGHVDARAITGLGFSKSSINSWLSGGRVRTNPATNARISRLWAALFVKEVFLTPQHFDELCHRFGRDRTTATEFTNGVAHRCLQLRNFVLALADDRGTGAAAGPGALWWFPPLAAAVAEKITDACQEELKPLLAVRHVSRGRARKLYDMGFHDVAAIAAVYPPTRLSDAIKNLGVWRAIDMVMHARTILRNEAVHYSVQAQDRYSVLGSDEENKRE